MLTFLAVNGFDVDVLQKELARWIIRLSDDLSPDGLAAFLKSRLVPLD